MIAATAPDPAAAFRVALTGVGLPDWLSWDVRTSTRRKTLGIVAEPGGALTFTVPAAADPERIAMIVRRERGKLVRAAEDKRDRGVYFARKDLVSGEGFKFAGRPYRLCLVDDSDTGRRCPCQCGRLYTQHPGVPIAAEPGHPGWSGGRSWQLTLRRDARSAATVIEWYREQGQAWLDEHIPGMLARLHYPADTPLPTWSVRPDRPGNTHTSDAQGLYRPDLHTMTFSWLIFQYPVELLRHVVAHEVAHAVLRGNVSTKRVRGGRVQTLHHGPEWQLMMDRLALYLGHLEWRELEQRARTCDRLILWRGEVTEQATQPGAEPFVSGWSGL